jgi:hypothetical protein
LPAAQDAGVMPAPDAAAPDAGPAATGEAGAPHPGGGTGLLAGMFGGGGATASAAPEGRMPSPAAALPREAGRDLLERSDANAFDRAVVAARVAQELLAEADAKRSTSEPAGTPTGPPATVPPESVVPPNEADPCATLVPSVMSCVTAQLGEAISAEEITEAVTECRTEFGGWPAERQAALRSCNATADCTAKLQCVAALSGTGAVPEGPDETVATAQPPPGTPDMGGMFPPPPDPARVAALPPDTRALCTQLATRIDECWDTLIGTLGGGDDPSVQAAMAGIRPQVRPGLENTCLAAALESSHDFQQMAVARRCFALPCDQLVTCIEDVENSP